jgi:NADH-quinone oxidoreductase subunit C
MLPFDQLFLRVKESCTHAGPVADETAVPKAVKVDMPDLKKVCINLRQNPSTFFDMLSCLTAVDNGPEAGTMEVIYHLYSIPFNHHLALKVMVDRNYPEVDSIEDIWKTANWHEREAYDMFGIKFKGHPDLRRILLPGDWEGFPLRKDYKQQKYYRGVKVEY